LDWKPDPVWDQLAGSARPSWYLDPLVARQKRDRHLKLFRAWMPAAAGSGLKTDVFEEAFGEDALLGDLAPLAQTWIAMDVAAGTVRQARARMALPSVRFLVCDVRRMPLRSASLDVVISNSTLDHFATRPEFEAAIAELARILRPGGRLLITTDNPHNLLYFPLRWLSRARWFPFTLGHTPSPANFRKTLEQAGLRVIDTSWLIHNPRMFSTALFLLLRRVWGARADGFIQWSLDAFALLEHLPTRRFTACFVGACAVRPPAAPL
jgi:ubiquinone/menaquinone biosynthesis C-methylase UbiE